MTAPIACEAFICVRCHERGTCGPSRFDEVAIAFNVAEAATLERDKEELT